MFWNYRVIESEDVFCIHEVYCNSKEEITAFSKNPITPLGDTLDELRGDLKYYLQALDRPVLKKEEIIFAPMDVKEEQALSIPIPSSEEQRKITEEVECNFSVIEELETVINLNLACTERLRQAILKKAFEGRLVRGYS